MVYVVKNEIVGYKGALKKVIRAGTEITICESTIDSGGYGYYKDYQGYSFTVNMNNVVLSDYFN